MERSIFLPKSKKDAWANLFDYMGSEENVRLKFAIDRIGIGLNEISIIFGDSRNGEAWDQFIASLKKEKEEEKEEVAPARKLFFPSCPQFHCLLPRKIKSLGFPDIAGRCLSW